MAVVVRAAALGMVTALIACSSSVGSVTPNSAGDEPETVAPKGAGGEWDADVGARPESSVSASADTCRVGDAGVMVVSEEAIDPTRGLSVSAGPQGALLSWTAYRDGKARLLQRFFTASEMNYELLPSDEAASQSWPASTRTATGFLTVWADDANGETHVRGRTLSAGGDVQGADPFELSRGARELRLAVALGADGQQLVGYLAEDGIRTVLLEADGRAGPSQAPLDGARPLGSFALAALGSGYALAYASADDGHVYLLELDGAGLAERPAVRLDADGFARGNVVMATTREGGAVAYDVLLGGVWGEVRLRTFDKSGALTLTERIATVYPEQGAMPAIRPMNGGYALLFRRTSGEANTLTLRLVDTRCEPLTDMHLVDVNSAGLPLALDVSPDGRRMLVGFMDGLPESPSYVLRRAWVVCDG